MKTQGRGPGLSFCQEGLKGTLNRPKKKELDVPMDAYVQRRSKWSAAKEMKSCSSVIKIDWAVRSLLEYPFIFIYINRIS